MAKVNNLAIQLAPKSFDEIYGHEHIIQEFKSWIVNDELPPLMLIVGPPGTGKGTLVHNLIRTTLCKNRKPDSATNCGKCSICKKMDARMTSPENNVIWIQTGNKNKDEKRGTIDSQVEAAIEYAQRPPVGNPLGDIGSKYHKFIVIDEIQSIKLPLLEKLYFISELGHVLQENRVTFILITMNEAKLIDKDPIAYKALHGRTGKGFFRLQSASTERLHKYALDILGVEDREIRNILVQAADGSIRDLIANYERIAQLPELNKTLVELKLGLASRSTRRKFWQLFSQGNNIDNNKLFRAYWSELKEKFGETSLIKQLLADINEVMSSNIPIGFIKAMVEYLRNPILPPDVIIFPAYLGTFVVDLPLLEDEISNEVSIDELSVF